MSNSHELLKFVAEFSLKVQATERRKNAGELSDEQYHAELLGILQSCTKEQLMLVWKFMGMGIQAGLLPSVSLPPEVQELFRRAQEPDNPVIQ